VELPLFDREPTSRYAPAEDITSRKHGGNAESEAAHEAVRPRKSEQQERVLAYVSQRGSATVWEISEGLGLPYTSVSARASELRRDGRLYATGRKRPTPTGSYAAVLAASR
jgi:hypothetical protein